jgi:hypothetical protein
MVLTDGIRRALQDGAASLKGYARRLFMARTVRDFGPGGQRFAEKEFDWNRRTIRMGAHELRTGMECVAAFNARGRKPIDARLPNLRADIKDLIDSQSQTDPRFESERVYCRLSASNVVELLIDTKGYTDLRVNADADASEHDLRLSVDCKGAVKIGEFSRGGTSRVLREGHTAG